MTKSVLMGLIGANIQKSLSPALHEDACAAFGIRGHYHLMDVNRMPGRRLDDLLRAVRIAGFAGVNVTYPFKEGVLPLLDEVASEARQIGAVNTVTIDAAGRTAGHNTDRIGFRRGFEETFGRIDGATVLLVGAGGAGRAVAFALIDLGAACLMIHDQDGARAQALVKDLAAAFGSGRCGVAGDPAAALAHAAGVVNATPVGMLGFPGNPLPPSALQPRHFVADVIYTPLETELLAAARAEGARVLNGGPMCVHQAVETFRLFTGLTPDVARMHRTFAAAAAVREQTMAGTMFDRTRSPLSVVMPRLDRGTQ